MVAMDLFSGEKGSERADSRSPFDRLKANGCAHCITH